MACCLGVVLRTWFELMKYFTDFHEMWFTHYACEGPML
jgi:hypothetical protein